MKLLLISLVLLAACSGLFFLAPHHRRTENSFKACTIAEIYGQFFRDMPEITSPRLLWFLLFGLAGLATAFYPAILLLLARWFAPAVGQGGGALFVLGGLIAVAGSLANLIAMMVSHMSFGFGVSDSSRDQTPFFWIIPSFQLVFAAMSVAMGCSATFAGWVSRLLTH